jgi:hypothetical protein
MAHGDIFMKRYRCAIIEFISAALLVVIFIVFMKTSSNPAVIIEKSLGVPPPKSARHIYAYVKDVADLKIIELWVTMEISLIESEQFMSILGVEAAPPGTWFEFPIRKYKIKWWTPPGQKTMEHLPNQWMRVDTGSTKAVPNLYSVWQDGKLYIYYFGFPRQMHTTSEDSNN